VEKRGKQKASSKKQKEIYFIEIRVNNAKQIARCEKRTNRLKE